MAAGFCGQRLSMERAMKISYDADVDALSITFKETTVTTRALGDGIAADYDEAGQLAGIEILDAAQRAGGWDPREKIVLQGLGNHPRA